MPAGTDYFSRMIKESGMKLTSQRLAIARLALSRKAHFSAEELLDLVRRKTPGLSRATVYRTLTLMTNLGLLSAVDFGDGRLYYEAAGPNHHDHLVCLRCGRVTEFNCGEIECLQEQVARQMDFTVDHHSLKIYGYCRKCRPRSKAHE